MRNLLILLIFFVILLGSSFVLLRHQSIAPEDMVAGQSKLGEVAIGGPFELVDGKGNIVTDASFRGRWMLVFFGFTSCPDICPTTLASLTQALNELGDDAKKIVPIFITIDPARDNGSVMASYVSHFHPQIVGLTGSPAQIERAALAYKIYYAKAPGGDDKNYMMDHSGYIYLMSPQGIYVRHFSHQASGDEIASAIRGYLN
jgi:protein SCO1/2